QQRDRCAAARDVRAPQSADLDPERAVWGSRYRRPITAQSDRTLRRDPPGRVLGMDRRRTQARPHDPGARRDTDAAPRDRVRKPERHGAAGVAAGDEAGGEDRVPFAEYVSPHQITQDLSSADGGVSARGKGPHLDLSLPTQR